MPTAAGAKLAEQQQAEQLALRARSLQGLLKLWRAVDPTDLTGTIGTFAQAAAILAGQGYDQSGTIAAAYYQLFRRAEGVPGTVPTILAAVPGADELAVEIRGAALAGIINARRSGADVETAKRNGFVRAAGALIKLVANGGRRTVIENVDRDRRSIGWARVTTSEDPCAFCRMLASRGPVYRTERGADFQTHDGCGCGAQPLFAGDTALAQAEEYASSWTEAQAAARDSGNPSRGTSNNALNNFRRFLAGATTGASSDTGGPG